MLHVLAQTSNVAGILGWSLVLIVLLLLGAGGVLWLRRWLKESDVPSGGLGFTLSDLRQLVREGKMTPEEYERARAKMMAGAKAMTEKLPDPLARGGRARRTDQSTPPVDKSPDHPADDSADESSDDPRGR